MKTIKTGQSFTVNQTTMGPVTYVVEKITKAGIYSRTPKQIAEGGIELTGYRGDGIRGFFAEVRAGFITIN